jgi:hypothetical protein
MKILTSMMAMLCLFLPLSVMAQDDHGDKTFHVQALDLTDSSLGVAQGDPCADALATLMGTGRNEKYTLLEATGVQGPPGVAYTLVNYSGHIAILKCGTSGCGSGDDGGHEPGQH